MQEFQNSVPLQPEFPPALRGGAALAPVPGPSMEQGGSAGKSYDPPHFAFRGTQAGVEFATKHRKYVSALNKDRCACRSARAAHGLCARSCRAE